MTSNKPTTTTYINTYNVNPTKSEVKLVMTKKKHANEVTTTIPTRFSKPRYSFDDNGGGYKGL